MKNPPMECRLLSVERRDTGGLYAKIIRLSAHPLLGKPNGHYTSTSDIEYIDPRHGLIVTQNSIYWWDTGRNDSRDS